MTAPADVRDDIARALERHDMTPREVVLVSPLGERKGVRLAYRVDLADGRRVKARHFGSEEAACRVFELHTGREVAFARPLLRSGAVVVEEWIEGRSLGDAEAEGWAEEAGGLLGRLHRSPLPVGAPAEARTGPWRDAAESDLALLAQSGGLAEPDVGSLRAALEARDPGAARVVLVHKDFCAENMLIDGHGRLRIIDNEQLDVAPAGFDLGRTFHRWPMEKATWARFLRAYRACAHAAPEATGFWKIVASLETTRVFLQRLPARLDASLARLRRFAAGLDLVDPS
jgi:aminoglycoside phosphotransferase (APT) family kinase protein